MRSFFIFAALSASAFASDVINERFVHHPANVLEKRQQFAPTTQMATGDTCSAAFGAGYVTCREKTTANNRLCYNPDIGQMCCQSSWACPSGSMCMPEPGQCCPNGGCPTASGANLRLANTTFTVTDSMTSTALRVSTVTGSFSNSTATLTRPASVTGTSTARTSSFSAAAALPTLEVAGTLVGLFGIAAALL